MARNYKSYMKNKKSKDYTLLKIFAISFFGMLLVFTYIINSFTPDVDVSIGGDYNQENNYENTDEIKKVVDNRLSLIQDEDQGKSFSEIMKQAEEKETIENPIQEENVSTQNNTSTDLTYSEENTVTLQTTEPIYKVFIGSYTSAEQAKVVKDIIQESGLNLTPIVKCIGSNNYTLQVGIFKNKASADSLLYSIQQNHLPGRIVQEY